MRYFINVMSNGNILVKCTDNNERKLVKKLEEALTFINELETKETKDE